MANVMMGAFLTDVITATEAENGRGFGLGDRYVDHLGREYVYVQYGTGGATGAGYVVSINAANSAVMTTNSASLRGERVGVAMAAASANEFGWVQIYGAVDVWTAIASANVAMATTTTAGEIDDASGTGTKQILGLVLTTAKTSAAGLAPGLLSYPTIGATN
jgi:hypothetical protein